MSWTILQVDFGVKPGLSVGPFIFELQKDNGSNLATKKHHEPSNSRDSFGSEDGIVMDMGDG